VGQINWKRVLLAGLAAGLLSNILGIIFAHYFMGREIETLMQERNLTFGPEVAALHLSSRFALGLFIVWMYAAIRPRFGPGPRTAAIVGVAVWLFTFTFSLLNTLPWKVFPPRVVFIMIGFAFLETAVCAQFGGWLYREP
jgi:hypothetical protein